MPIICRATKLPNGFVVETDKGQFKLLDKISEAHRTKEMHWLHDVAIAQIGLCLIMCLILCTTWAKERVPYVAFEQDDPHCVFIMTASVIVAVIIKCYAPPSKKTGFVMSAKNSRDDDEQSWYRFKRPDFESLYAEVMLWIREPPRNNQAELAAHFNAANAKIYGEQRNDDD